MKLIPGKMKDPITVPKQLEMPKGKIGPNFTRKILPWVEMYWHTHKRYPSETALAAEFGLDAAGLQRLHASKFYLHCLRERGISHEPAYLNEKQVAAISLVTNIYDQRPVAAKLAAIGVSSEEYNGWMSNPKFKQELMNRAEEITENLFPDAQAALAKKVQRGDVNALKFYYEISGRTNSPETVNLKLTVVKLIEAVQKHVRDPAVLQAIASEIQGITEAPVAQIPNAPIPNTASPLKNQFKKHLEAVKDINLPEEDD